MFTSPLTLDEYRVLVDVKYSPDAATAARWELADKDGRVHGWHPRQPGSAHWAHHDDALRAFVPDRKRHPLALLGHTVTATTGIDELVTLLRHERGDAAHHPRIPQDTAAP